MDGPGNVVPRTADQDRTISSITVNGAVLHSEAFGHRDSSMIVCLHGGPGNDYRYILNYKDLADHGYVPAHRAPNPLAERQKRLIG